jgi:enoyl-CoA hydratase/carnithine racemase
MVEGNLHEFEKGRDLGVINYIWAAEQDGRKWWDQVMEYAWSFCPPNKAAKAVGRIKRAAQTGWEVPLESALALERELQQQLFQSEDAAEGLAAYKEKRKAEFAGK